MSFLGDLGSAIASQFNLGENTTTSLDAVIDGQQVKYGSLGDFASQFDQSAQRSYVEEGYLRRDPFNTDPKQFEVLWQEPNATVLLKKRQYSSVAENFRPDFMDADEKLYYKAMNVLFQNKCNQIAALEQLSKIAQITAAVGNISNQLVPWIITLTDIANNGYASGNNLFGSNTNPFTTQDGSSFIKSVNRLRTLYAYNQPNQYTTWIADATNLFQSTFGGGSGVIEITNYTSLSTTSSVDIKQPGSFNLSIVDPYEAMLITDYDIELALSDATNLFYNNKTFQLGVSSSQQVIQDQQSQLNAIRSARNASPITFKVDPDTLLGKRVTAIIDRLGLEIVFTYNPLGSLSLGGNDGVDVDPRFLRGSTVPNPDGSGGIGSLAGYDGLDQNSQSNIPGTNVRALVGNSELKAFQTIIATIYNQISLISNSRNALFDNNDSYNYARRKLRFNFSGKLIIQPMDVVHIYLSSKSQYDNKVLSGLTQMFSGAGILQNISNTITSITNAADTLFNPSANISVAAEKAIYVGPDFPNFLWALVRTQFVTEQEGTHVFSGVVESAVDNWNGGRFSIDVSGKDNTYYFDQGKINFKPGADNFNGLIFDPLTPFQTSYDSVTVNNLPTSGTPTLLYENQYLLSTSGQGSLVKYKQGALTGQKATQGNYVQDQGLDPTTGLVTKTLYLPNGLCYKWKQGIGVFVRAGNMTQISDPNLVGPPTVKQEPFAGLDVMNVLSLLITGIPYNYATYFKATGSRLGFNGDPQSKQSPVRSYLDSLSYGLARNNALWGNFIPYKSLVMDDLSIAKIAQAQASANASNPDIELQIKKLLDLQNMATTLGAVQTLVTNVPGFSDPTQSAQVAQVQAQISNLQTNVNNAMTDIQSNVQSFYSQTDTSASYDLNYMTDGGTDPSDTLSRRLLRQQTNYLTRRMSYDVRANQDKNLMIVDDYYDSDYDVAAFNNALGGLKLYSNEFTSVREKITNVADLLNLEVFADSQGHIRVRPPQYNKVPSSIFYRMIYLKQSRGVQVFPKFLDQIFTSQLSTLQQHIEVIEDQIRLDCALLGQYPSLDTDGDGTAHDFLTSQQVTGGMSSVFNFLSDPSSGTVTDYNTLIAQANQEQFTGSVDQGLANFDSIQAAGTSTKSIFTVSSRYAVIIQSIQAQNQASGGQNVSFALGTSVFQTSQVQQLMTRIFLKSGQRIVSKSFITPVTPNQPAGIDTGQTIDIFKVTQELSERMQDWQKSVKLFYHAIKNAAEFQSLGDDTSLSNALQTPGLFHNSYIPEVYQHMIEDESYDDYGPGSGSRYIIKRRQIRSITLSENSPPWTSVEVQGTFPNSLFAENLGNQATQLQAFPGGGNSIVSAVAMDYDMWRNYGFRSGAVIKVPFLGDPQTQVAPYAAMVLTRNRSNILRGTITISGNEYMQPGEVIYLEDRNLLFYVNSVRHSLQLGSGFTTTLELTYGHSVGEYIPTYLDTIGKILYRNAEIASYSVHRQDSSLPERSIGVIQVNGRQPTASVLSTSDNSPVSDYTASNMAVINNILYTTAFQVNNNGIPGNNVQASVELRIYFDNSNSVSSTLQQQANAVMAELTGGSQGIQTSISLNQPVQNPTLPSQSVSVVLVNMDDQTDPRSPSQKAVDAARNQMANVSTNAGNPSPSNPIGNDDGTSTAGLASNNNALRTALYSYIIDCWIAFKQVPDTVASKSTADPGY
jgi:hypothetical protein